MPINQPSNQIKLTNVSIVRMRKGKKRFEIACYQNKVQDWRSGAEKNIDEVVQIPTVFLNVSKGQVVPHNDLKTAFGTTDMEKAVLEILNKGEVQVGDKERQAKSLQYQASIIEMVTSKCVNPKSMRPYPSTMIEKALSEVGFNFQSNKPVKSQALDAIKLLTEKQIIPITRARMRIRILIPSSKDGKKTKEKIEPLLEGIEEEDWTSDEWDCVAFIEPGKFRTLDEVIRENSKGRGNIQVLDTAVIKEGDTAL